jgi:hypothetical protein
MSHWKKFERATRDKTRVVFGPFQVAGSAEKPEESRSIIPPAGPSGTSLNFPEKFIKIRQVDRFKCYTVMPSTQRPCRAKHNKKPVQRETPDTDSLHLSEDPAALFFPKISI